MQSRHWYENVCSTNAPVRISLWQIFTKTDILRVHTIVSHQETRHEQNDTSSTIKMCTVWSDCGKAFRSSITALRNHQTFHLSLKINKPNRKFVERSCDFADSTMTTEMIIMMMMTMVISVLLCARFGRCKPATVAKNNYCWSV